MSVTKTNYYTSSGSDLINVFQTYTGGTKTTTNYKVNGTDLCDIFQPYTSTGTVAASTGINIGGNDLNTYFEGKYSYTISGSPTYTKYYDNEYTVLVFKNSLLGSISFNTNKTVNYIVVGNGGDGGDSGSGSQNNGGGGGGGGEVLTGSLSLTKNATASIYVNSTISTNNRFGSIVASDGGNGGSGGSGDNSGGTGGSGGGNGGNGGDNGTSTPSTDGSNGTYIGDLPIDVTISGNTYTYLAGGGAGGSYYGQGSSSSGGLSGGGASSSNGTANTGGGGGGGNGKATGSDSGGNGASGVVILYFT